MMKRKVEKLIAVCVFTMTASAFLGVIGLNKTNVSAAEALSDFRVKGASVRVVDGEYGPAVRFHVEMSEAEYESYDITDSGVTTGTLILPESKLQDGTLDLNSAGALNIVTKDDEINVWRENSEGKMESVAFVSEIPSTDYSTELSVVGYITKANGETVYTQQVNDISLAWVAYAEYTDENPLISDADKRQALMDTYATFDVSFNGETPKRVQYGQKLTAPGINGADGKALTGWYNRNYTYLWDFSEDIVKSDVNLFSRTEIPDECASGANSGNMTATEDGSLKLVQGEGQTTYPGYWIDLRSLSADGNSALDLTSYVLEFEYCITSEVYSLNVDFLDIPNNTSKVSAVWPAADGHIIVDSWGDSYNSDGVTLTPVDGKDGWYKFTLTFRESKLNQGEFSIGSVAFLRITCSLAGTKDVGTELCSLDGLKISWQLPWYIKATSATNTGVVASDGEVVILKQGDATIPYPGSIVDLRKASPDGASALDFSAGGSISFEIKFLSTYALNIDLYDGAGESFTIQIWLNTDMSSLIVNTAEGFVSAGVTATRNGEWVHVEIEMGTLLSSLAGSAFAADNVVSVRLTNSESSIPAVGTELYHLKDVAVVTE